MNARETVGSKQGFDVAALCRPIAECSLMPMAAMEGAGHILSYVNSAFCLLAGKTREELTGKTFLGTVEAGEECRALLDRVYQTGHPEIHAELESSTSHPFYWSYAAWPILTPEDQRIGVMIQVTEATAFHRRATALNQALIIGSVRQHELTAEADKLNEQLGWANEDLKQFAFAASHDLQEPLRMITAYAQLLVRGYRGQLDSEAAVCVDFITRGTKQMRELLADLLSYTEAGAAKGDANESVDLNEVLAEVKQNLKGPIEANGAVLTCVTLPTVQGHRARFIQLFQNLIGNAIKYHGGRPPRIGISVERRNGEWRFAVNDNGMGVAAEYYQTIFGVFKRLHGKEIPGTGIGLAICQRVVERYGGRIWVESQVGHGTTFYFTLPAEEETK